MRTYAVRVAVATIAALTLTAISAGPASADTEEPTPIPSVSVSPEPLPENPDDWQPPADWEVPDESADIPVPTDDPEVPDGESLPTVRAPKPTETIIDTPNNDDGCIAQWKIMSTKKFATRMGKVGPNFSSYFGNGGTQTLTAGITGTITATASANLEASLSVKSILSAKASASGSLATSVAVTGSLAETQPVPKGYWGNAFWGASKMPVSFKANHYGAGNCKLLESKSYTVWYPFKPSKSVGWCKWVSKSSLGSRPAACNASGYLKF